MALGPCSDRRRRGEDRDVQGLLDVADIHKSFRADGVERPVLRGLSLRVAPGEWVAVMGPSGCGKSTMLHLVGGLDLPDSGRITLAGREVTALGAVQRSLLRRKQVGYVFQQYNLIPHLDVAANVELALRLAGTGRRAARARALELLVVLGLDEHRGDLPATLSGGQQQRVAIARAIANEPDLLLADEPTGALDSTSSAGVMELLRAQHADGQTIVMVTHDPAIAAAADRIIQMFDGRIVDPTGAVPVVPV
jgi:putative ABC transport system ATP-binding protein